MLSIRQNGGPAHTGQVPQSIPSDTKTIKNQLKRLDQTHNYLHNVPPLPASLECVGETPRQTRIPHMPLPEIKRTGTRRPEALPLVMDSRFGKFGYSRMDLPQNQHYQLRLTSPGSESRDQASPLSAVDMNDKGYGALIEFPDGHCDAIAPNTAPHIVHTADAMHGLGFSIPLPSVIEAEIVHLPQAAGGADYIAFTFGELNPDNGTTIHNVHYVPFSTYRQLDGTVIGIADCGNHHTLYRFSVNPSDMPLTEFDSTITLTLAEPQDVQKLIRFQELLRFKLPVDGSYLADAVKLGEETSDVQEKFDRVFERSQEMLNGAIDAKRLFPDIVKSILGKLTSRQLDDPKLARMLETIATGWEKMRDAMPSLESQKAYVIGTFEGGKKTTEGISQPNSMACPISLKHLRHALIFLRRSLLTNAKIPLNNLATLLIHEFSHALLNTSDAMHPGKSESVYEGCDRKIIDLLNIEQAAAQEGSEPENHACTFEVFTEICSYLSDSRTKNLAMQYLKYSTSHSYVRAEDSIYTGKEDKAPEHSKTPRFADVSSLARFLRNRATERSLKKSGQGRSKAA
jgi:hypothetical protein